MTNTTTRPTVDFSGTSRATAREYAQAVNSRVLTDKSQATLRLAAAGYKVDANYLNEAVTDAMRSASTRFDWLNNPANPRYLGQSMARRDLVKKIAYLGHITQAALEAHATIEEQREEIERLQAERSSLVAEIDALRRQAETKAGEHHAYKVAADDEVSRLLALANVRDALLAETVKERDSWAAIVFHVLDNVDPEGKIRLLWYIGGHQDGSGI